MGFEVKSDSNKEQDSKINEGVSIVDVSRLDRLIVLAKEVLNDKDFLEDIIRSIDKLKNYISYLTSERDNLSEENERLDKFSIISINTIIGILDALIVKEGILQFMFDEVDAIERRNDILKEENEKLLKSVGNLTIDLQSMTDERDEVKRERDILKEKLDSLVGENKGTGL